MTSSNATKVFQKDGSEIFSKKNKTASSVFLDNNIKRYDV